MIRTNSGEITSFSDLPVVPDHLLIDDGDDPISVDRGNAFDVPDPMVSVVIDPVKSVPIDDGGMLIVFILLNVKLRTTSVDIPYDHRSRSPVPVRIIRFMGRQGEPSHFDAKMDPCDPSGIPGERSVK